MELHALSSFIRPWYRQVPSIVTIIQLSYWTVQGFLNFQPVTAQNFHPATNLFTRTVLEVSILCDLEAQWDCCGIPNTNTYIFIVEKVLAIV